MNGLANSAFAKVVFSIKKSFPFSIFNYSITKKANSKFLKFESNDEVVEPFEERPGILAVTSGYTGGHIEYPTYDQVLSKASGHTEAVEILFDNELISYDELLDIYWSLIDPTDADGQIYDRGANYRPVIFVESEEQRIAAQKSKIALEKSGIWDKPIVVPIEEAKTFWPAEEYHQQYYKKDPKRYQAMHKARERYLALQRFKGKFKFLRKNTR